MHHILDIIGAVFSFFSALFFMLAMEICYPLGVIATVVNGTLYGLSGIYGDMSLEIMYFFFMFYGWYEWRYGGKGHTKIKITNLKWRTALVLLAIAAVGITITYFILKAYARSHVPALDSTTTVLSLVAQWMISMKIIECWFLWFVVDLIYVLLYFDKMLPVHSALQIIYLGMAALGYWRWYQLKQKNKGVIKHG